MDLSPLSLFAVVFLAGTMMAAADDEVDQPAKEHAAKQRLELMQSLIADIRVSAPNAEPEGIAKFSNRPVLRYSDQTRALFGTRHLLDASVWRLGERGRPLALVTLEIYPLRAGEGKASYEFISLSPSEVRMQLPTGAKWTAAHTELKMEPLADGPRPADSPTARLVQMRQLARRFSVREDVEENKVECRLLSQPIDRYADDTEKAETVIKDGAIFVFANGTNPEAGLVLECSDKNWSFGLFRLSSAAVFAELDGKPCFEAPAMGGYPYSLSAPYTATDRVIKLAE
ncbi:MAG TPA: hypothetical protein VG826_08310 [Pirellulales bacterium]|nr:hypothetical protein [Pirellulales bacterium]